MAGYTAISEVGNSLVELLRREMTPEPVSKPELIGLCSPYEPEDFQLTVFLFHCEQENQAQPGFVQESRDVQRKAPLRLRLNFLITPHSKAPVQNRAADELRILGRAMQVISDNASVGGELLSGSLADGGEALLLSMPKMNLEQLQKIWNLSSKPYKLSFAVQCSVAIDSTRTRTVGRVKDVELTLDEKSIVQKGRRPS